METNDTAIAERQLVAATLYAAYNLIDAGEIDPDDVLILADRVMDTAYGDSKGFKERARLLDSVLETTVPAIMDAIRIASMEEELAAPVAA